MYVPKAENCNEVLAATFGAFGEMTSAVRLGGATVSMSVPVIPLSVALMELVPALTPVASPEVETMVATAGTLDSQLAVEDTSFVVPSLYLAVAVNCRFNPAATDAVAGVTVMEVTVGAGGGVPPPPLLGPLLPPPPQAATRTDIPNVTTIERAVRHPLSNVPANRIATILSDPRHARTRARPCVPRPAANFREPRLSDESRVSSGIREKAITACRIVRRDYGIRFARASPAERVEAPASAPRQCIVGFIRVCPQTYVEAAIPILTVA